MSFRVKIFDTTSNQRTEGLSFQILRINNREVKGRIFSCNFKLARSNRKSRGSAFKCQPLQCTTMPKIQKHLPSEHHVYFSEIFLCFRGCLNST